MDTRENLLSITTGTMVRFVLVCLLFTVLYLLKNLVLVVLVAIVIASSIEPITQWLTKRKVPRLVAVIGIYISLFLVIIGSLYFLVLPLLSESADFLKHLPQYFNETTITHSIDSNAFLSSQSIVTDLRNNIDIGQIVDNINTIVSNFSGNVLNSILKVFGGMLSFVLMIVLSFYLSVEADGVGKFLKILSPLKHERYVESLWKRSQHKIGLWMQGQLILAVIIGMLVYLGLLLLNIPNALLLASLAAICEIVPLFGPILASIPAIAIAFVSGGFSSSLLIVGLYLIVHQFENQLIYPLVVKKVIGVSPIVSMVALVAGWELFGFLGLVLSVPMTTIVIEFFEDLERDKIETIERMKNA